MSLRSCTVDTRAISADLLKSTTRWGASRMRVDARGIWALLRTRGPEHRRAAQLEGNHLSDASAPSPSSPPDSPIHHERHLRADLECNRYWIHQKNLIFSLHLIILKFRSYWYFNKRKWSIYVVLYTYLINYYKLNTIIKLYSYIGSLSIFHMCIMFRTATFS